MKKSLTWIAAHGKHQVAAALLAMQAACGGDGGGSGPDPDAAATEFTVSGTISGLGTGGLALLNNGTNNLTVPSAATRLSFNVKVARGAAYTGGHTDLWKVRVRRFE